MVHRSTEDRESAKNIALILKDADAIDRTRFPGNLDEGKLRTDSAKCLIEASYQIQELRGTKYLNENNFSESTINTIQFLRDKGVSDYEIAFWIKNQPNVNGEVMPVWYKVDYKIREKLNWN